MRFFWVKSQKKRGFWEGLLVKEAAQERNWGRGKEEVLRRKKHNRLKFCPEEFCRLQKNPYLWRLNSVKQKKLPTLPATLVLGGRQSR